MLKKIIEASVRNQFLVRLFVVAAIAAGVYAFKNIPVDALPDVSDVQVIVFTRLARSTAADRRRPSHLPYHHHDAVGRECQGRARLLILRVSFVYVIFKDGTDIYWARSRVLEYLSFATGPDAVGSDAELGPDATPVGWVYEYALVDHSGDTTSRKLRTIQDWYLRYQLKTVPGVAECRFRGRFCQAIPGERRSRISCSPTTCLLSTVVQGCRAVNNDVGGEVVEYAEAEYMIEGIGYIENVERH